MLEGEIPLHANIQVQDEFYTDPYSVRNFALSCDFSRAESGTWNGYHSLQRHPQTKEVFFKIARMISEEKTPNWDDIETSFQFWGKPTAGMFALLLESQSDTVHFHRRSGTWAGVCYLTLPDHCNSRLGVSFYRHKATGLETCRGAAPAQILQLRQDASDRTKWEEIYSVPMLFNRMVIFDGRYFHAASDGFGHTVDDGRLTQLFNLDFLEQSLKYAIGLKS